MTSESAPVDSIQREPCHRCGEPAALAARVCPHCGGSALVDVFATQAVPDPRRRYQVARVVVGLGVPGASIGSVQSALGLPGMPIASSLTRAAARALIGALGEHGVAAAERHVREAAGAREAPVRPFGKEPPARRGRPVVPVLLLGMAAFAAVGTWRELRPRAGEDVPAGGGGSSTVPATAADAAGGDVLTTRQVAERAMPSTVSLRCRSSVGAGFFVAEELLLSNAHVACPGERFIQAVLDGGRQLAAELVKRDDDLDLATFRIPGARGVPLPLGDATALGPGDRVVLIGSPRGLEFTVHEGIVSNAGRNHLGVAYLQIDANVNPGNSGGPLLDSGGRVVGIVSMMVGRGSGLGLVLPVNYAYDGPAPFVPRPSAAEKGRWSELLARVGESDRREVEQINTAFEGYPGGLVALTAGPGGMPIAAVARRFRGTAEPAPAGATFEVFQGGRRQCGRSYTIDRWQPVRDEPAGQERRFYRWMKRNGVTQGLYVGFADLQWIRSDCSTVDWRSDAELRLQAARAPVDTLVLRPGADREE